MVEYISEESKKKMIPLLTSFVHDINNLCTCIFSNLSVVNNSLDNPSSVQQHIDNAKIATAKALEVSGMLLKIVNDNTFDKEYCNLQTLLTDAVQITQPVLSVPVELLYEKEHCIVYANPVCISNIILSLLVNLNKTFLDIQKITIDCSNKVNRIYEHLNQRYVQIQITISRNNENSPDNKPFTKELELLVSTILHTIIDIHKGTLSLDCEHNSFKNLTIEFPIVECITKLPG